MIKIDVGGDKPGYLTHLTCANCAEVRYCLYCYQERDRARPCRQGHIAWIDEVDAMLRTQ